MRKITLLTLSALLILLASCQKRQLVRYEKLEPVSADLSFDNQLDVRTDVIEFDINKIHPIPTIQQKRNNWKRLGLFTTSILLDAAGDAFCDNDNKELGHLLNAASLGVTVSIPLLIDIDKTKWYSYILEYGFLRFALFDYAYNAFAGLPYDYHGNTSYYDKVMSSQENWLLAKGVGLSIGITINFQYLNK